MTGRVAAHCLFFPCFQCAFPWRAKRKGKACLTLQPCYHRLGVCMLGLVCVVAVFKVLVFGLTWTEQFLIFFWWEWFSALTKQSIILTLYSAVPAGARTHFHSYFIHTSLHFSVTNLYSCCRYSLFPFIRVYNLSKIYHLMPHAVFGSRWLLCWNVNEACKC